MVKGGKGARKKWGRDRVEKGGQSRRSREGKEEEGEGEKKK